MICKHVQACDIHRTGMVLELLEDRHPDVLSFTMEVKQPIKSTQCMLVSKASRIACFVVARYVYKCIICQMLQYYTKMNAAIIPTLLKTLTANIAHYSCMLPKFHDSSKRAPQIDQVALATRA